MIRADFLHDQERELRDLEVLEDSGIRLISCHNYLIEAKRRIKKKYDLGWPRLQASP
jgi:hypothetical protein